MLEPEPVPAGDVILTGGDQGVMYALDPATGAVKWSHRVGTEPDRIRLARVGPTVYAVSAGGTVHALEALSGDLRWKSRVGNVNAHPVVAGEVLHVGDNEGATYAISTRTGKLLWTFRVKRNQVSHMWSAAAADGLLCLAGADGRLYGLDTTTGTVRWSRPLARGAGAGFSGRGAGPVVSGGTVYLTDHDGTLHALDAATGTVRSKFRIGGTAATDPVVADGFVYVGSSNGNVYARPS